MLIERAIDGFLRSREAMGCTASTMRSYRTELPGSFTRFLRGKDILETEQISVDALTDYLIWYRDRGCSASTIVTMRVRFGAFVNWCSAMGYCAPDLLKKVPRPRVRQYIRRCHTDDEIKKVLETAADQRLYHPFDSQELVGLFMLLLDTGLRAAEIVGLNVGDVDGELIKVRGKGDKDRYVMISDLTRKALQEYLQMRPLARTDEPLFVNRGYGRNYHLRGLRLSVAGLYQRVKRLGVAAGVHTSPHRWRHTFAAVAVRNGAGMKALQLFLGHNSLQTTDNYLRGFGWQDAAREHKTFSPIAGLFQH